MIAACLWVLAAALTAMLPLSAQYLPGLSLLVAAPVLAGWIGAVHGPWVALAMLVAAASMFRKPLIHLARRVAGLPEKRAQASDEGRS
nr:DUF2484 family protein [Oceaniglobus trochenteri]